MNRLRLMKKPDAIVTTLLIGRVAIGEAAMENAARAGYQSARTPLPGGGIAPLPLTLAEAWAEAEALRPGLFPNGDPTQ